MTYVTADALDTQLAPQSAGSLSPDLSLLVRVWERLPAHVRETIMTLAEAARRSVELKGLMGHSRIIRASYLLEKMLRKSVQVGGTVHRRHR